jgi:hypothetical protein
MPRSPSTNYCERNTKTIIVSRVTAVDTEIVVSPGIQMFLLRIAILGISGSFLSTEITVQHSLKLPLVALNASLKSLAFAECAYDSDGRLVVY